MENTSSNPLDGRVRRAALRAGFRASKARGQLHSNNRGGYMLVDSWTNAVVHGVNYELSPADVMEICSEKYPR